jgi:hypothetical protein
MSPVGLGVCPSAEDIGAQMIGRDGTRWLNVIKNGKKSWIRSQEIEILVKDIPLSCRTKEENQKSCDENVPVKVLNVKTGKVKKQALEDNPANFENNYEKQSANGILYIIKTDKSGKKKWVKKPEKPEKPSLEENITTKTRKTRAPNTYNMFISSKLKELRAQNPNLETTKYMKDAVALWKSMSEEEKKALKT